MKNEKNQNILRLKETFETENSIIIITEYCENGNMDCFENKDLKDDEILEYF